jgi:hypothetical protein
MFRIINLIICLLLFNSCALKPRSQSYGRQYAHLNIPIRQSIQMTESEYFLVILVDGKHLDYTHSQSFLQTFTKHPSNGSKEGQVGHAWIYLKGKDSVLEGGHSGEYGVIRPRYVDGMMHYLVCGDPDPVRYLWEPLNDGHFQKGSGGHTPSYAAKFDLSKKEYEAILTFIHPQRYPYKNYSLTGRQCTSYISQIAALADIHLEIDVTMKILPTAKVSGEYVRMWQDPKYASITFSSPDILERSLIKKVNQGEAEYALQWYLKSIKHSEAKPSIFDTLKHFPYRYHRHRSTF